MTRILAMIIILAMLLWMIDLNIAHADEGYCVDEGNGWIICTKDGRTLRCPVANEGSDGGSFSTGFCQEDSQ